MNIIIYGEKNDIFESNCVSIPEAIVELYKYCGGRVGSELFASVIEGMVRTATIQDMVTIFEHLVAGGVLIRRIYAGADRYFTEVGFDG